MTLVHYYMKFNGYRHCNGFNHAYGTSTQVDAGVPVMGVFLIDNRPRRARRAGAARKRAAPSPPVERGGQKAMGDIDKTTSSM